MTAECMNSTVVALFHFHASLCLEKARMEGLEWARHEEVPKGLWRASHGESLEWTRHEGAPKGFGEVAPLAQAAMLEVVKPPGTQWKVEVRS